MNISLSMGLNNIKIGKILRNIIHEEVQKILKEEIQPEFEQLENILISIGGEKVAKSYEEDLKKILERGQNFDRVKSQVVKMRDNRCHSNSACFWGNYSNEHGTDSVKIVTGWALSKNDQTWRQHTWIYLPKENLIVETTIKRIKYFGFILNDEETNEFYDMNW